MNKNRLEAFSDGVLAIIITILVLDLRAPESATWASLKVNADPFLTYVISFVHIAIYWTNHHHLLQATKKISGEVLWANTLLLFTLSLVPFATSWVGEHMSATAPQFVYCAGHAASRSRLLALN